MYEYEIWEWERWYTLFSLPLVHLAQCMPGTWTAWHYLPVSRDAIAIRRQVLEKIIPHFAAAAAAAALCALTVICAVTRSVCASIILDLLATRETRLNQNLAFVIVTNSNVKTKSVTVLLKKKVEEHAKWDSHIASSSIL